MAEETGAAASEGSSQTSGAEETPQEQTTEKAEETKAAPDKEAKTTQTNWRDTIKDSKLRAQADRFDNPQSIIESLNKVQGEVSQRIKPLGEDASDEDVEKYRKALDIPAESAGYEFIPPEGVEWDDESSPVLDRIGTIFLENNIPKGAAQRIVTAYEEMAQEMSDSVSGELTKLQEDATRELELDWGSDNNANRELIRQLVDQTGEEFKDLMDTKIENGSLIGDNPTMMRFLARYARATTEHEMLLGVSGSESLGLQDEIDQMERDNPPGTEGYKDPRFQRKLTDLYDRKYGKESVIGGPI